MSGSTPLFVIFLFMRDKLFSVAVNGTGLQLVFPHYTESAMWKQISTRIEKYLKADGFDPKIFYLGEKPRVSQGRTHTASYIAVRVLENTTSLPPSIDDCHDLRWLTIDQAEEALESQSDFLALREALDTVP